MRIKNLPSIESMNGSQDALVIEQTDGSEDKSRKVSPAQIKQYVLGNSIDDIYSVMGQMGAKNLIPYPYYNTSQTAAGITITDNGDGTLTLNGTASANTTVFKYLNNDAAIEIPLERRKYKLTFGTDQGSSGFHLGDYRIVKTDYTTQTVNVTGDTIIDNTNGDYLGIDAMSVYVAKNKAINNVTIYPMLRLAADTDDTYQPYAKTNRQLTEDKAELESVRDYVNELGAKNLIPYPYASDSYSQRGIDFTCLSDGTIKANGTNDGTGNSTYSFVRFALSKGSYVLNGCPIQTDNNYRCGLIRVSDDTTLVSDYGNGAKLTLDADTDVRVFVQVFSGKTANNIIYKPMLRLASDINDDTYVPFAMTNKQLTEVIGDLSQTGLTGDSVAEQLDTAREQISDLTTKKANTWMPDVYDFNTKVKTLTPDICTTYVQKIGDLTVAYLGIDSGTSLGSFSTMMQLRGFPEGCTRCIGGYIYNSSLESSPRVVQASNVGVYFRPNITGNMSSGFVSALLFFN